jgi:hypothetical protein
MNNIKFEESGFVSDDPHADELCTRQRLRMKVRLSGRKSKVDRDGGACPNVCIVELLNNQCCFAIASGGNVRRWKSCRSYVLTVNQVLRDSWLRIVVMVGMALSSSGVFKGMYSRTNAFELSVSAMLRNFRSYDMDVLDRMW